MSEASTVDQAQPSARSNFEVAERFIELADYLELLGENEFKIRAYRNAAHTLETLPESIADVAAADRLDDIPGFGDAIRAKTKDILATGTTKALEDARSKAPASALQLLGLPGVGTKTIHQLFAIQHIHSLEELEKAVDEHKLRDISGFGEKTEAKIKEAIDRSRRYSKRMLLSEARNLGEALVSALRKRPEVQEVEYAGSARRGVETVGDIDLVGSSTDPAVTMQAFTKLLQVSKILAQGEKITRVILRNGFQADLKLVHPGDFGTLLHHFTGSRDHNIHLREIAERRGLKINEYGVWRLSKDGGEDEKLPIGDDEMGIYRALDLPPIEVELRENRGEIEAAQQGRLPKLIELGDIKGDLHVHTTATDGKGTIEGMCLAARKLNYQYLAITDHSQSLTVANGLTPERLREQVKQVREASEKLDFPILAGTECDIKADGTLDFPDELLAELDIVIASVHSRFNLSREEMTARIVRAIENPNVDLIAHPTGRLINQRDPYEIEIDAIVAAAKRTDTALEINSFPERLDLSDIYARLAKDAGVKIMINTDAHAPNHFDLIRYGIVVARRAWIEPKDVLNTLPLAELTDWLKRDR